MDLDITLSHDEFLHIPPLNISHSYPVPQHVTKTIIEDGFQWLNNVNKLLEKNNLEDGEWISWATYHANITEPPPFPLSQSYTLPLFIEFPTSPTMAWHAMKILSAATKYLNPHQTPVMVGDQRHKCCLWPRSYNGNSLKHNLVKIISWSYLAQCIQQNKRPAGHYNPRPVRVIEIGQVHPELSHFVLQYWFTY